MNRRRSSRNRGIRASRARLYSALEAAGLKTQAALAERIADREGLDAAPRDLVNRVFRELPVEPRTLERVARALEVEAFTLYRNSGDPAVQADQWPREYPRRSGRWVVLIAACGALALVGFALVWIGPPGPDSLEPAASEAVEAEFWSLDPGPAGVLVLPFDGDEDEGLAAALRAQLDGRFSVATASATALLAELSPAAAAATLRTELVVQGEVVRVGRFAAVRADAIRDGIRRQIWAESLPETALSDATDRIAANIGAALARFSATGIDDDSPHFPLAPVQDDYLEGRFFLDRPASELNLKRAQTRFEAALRQDSNFALAHAGLCEALLEEHWMSDEQRALDDAARACGRALQLAPMDPEVRAAEAHFLRLTGRIEESIAVYEEVMDAHPDPARVLASHAFTVLQKFRQSGRSEDLERAMDSARAATDADPAYWKAPFFLASMNYFSGDLAAAIAAAELALSRDENEMILANLGSFRFCAGELAAARDAYLRAGEIAPHSYVGDEFLGMVQYYLGEYVESVRLRRRAIESVAIGAPEIHQMWGNLGDSERQAGNPEAARDAYLRAIEILERDILRGTSGPADRAARAWYYTMLGELDPGRVNDAIVREIGTDLELLDGDGLDPTAHLRLAQAWLRHGDPTRAGRSLERALETCPVFSMSPDLAGL